MKTAEIRANKFDISQMQFHFLQVSLSLFEMYTVAVAPEKSYEMTVSVTVLW